MKRRELIRHLTAEGCVLLREGSRHSWWHNPVRRRRSAVPRHSEIQDILARKICHDRPSETLSAEGNFTLLPGFPAGKQPMLEKGTKAD